MPDLDRALALLGSITSLAPVGFLIWAIVAGVRKYAPRVDGPWVLLLVLIVAILIVLATMLGHATAVEMISSVALLWLVAFGIDQAVRRATKAQPEPPVTP